jgi:predicted branched-subunit amino acid permease
MRTLFITTGIVLFPLAFLYGLSLSANGAHVLEKVILAVGFAIAGGMCYIAAALHEAARKVRAIAHEREYDKAG